MATAAPSIDHHNSVLRRAVERAYQLEPKLVRVLKPVLREAAVDAAATFEARATSFLTAAASRDAAVLAHAGVGARALMGSLSLSGAVPGLTSLSTMIAVKPRPSEAETASQRVPGGEAADTLHVTLAYLGDYEGDLEALADALRLVAAEHAPLVGQISGVGAFGPGGGDEPGPALALPSVPGLVELRVCVTRALAEAGVEFSDEYGFIPHMTVAYDDGVPDRSLVGLPLHFDDLLIVRGNTEIVPLPLTGASPLTASLVAGAVVAETDIGKEIGEVAARHAPDGGYGDTAWNDGTKTVLWIAADWTSNEEWDAAEADFLAIDGVEEFESDAEIGLPESDEWEVVYRSSALGAVTSAADWGAPDETLDVDKLVKSLRTKTDPVRRAVIETTMTATLDGVGIDWDADNPFTAEVLKQSGSQIVDVAETSRRNVNKIIAGSYKEGLSIRDTAKAIRVGMAEADTRRALLITRTEMVGAVNGGSLAATHIVAKASGVTYQKQWLVGYGAKHPRHERYPGLNMQTVTLEGYFTVGGSYLQHPGDPAGPPHEICNCRCSMSYVEGPAARKRGEDAGVVETPVAAPATPLPPAELQAGESLTDGPATAHLDERYRSWGKSLSTDEVEAFSMYRITKGFAAINDYLRWGRHADSRKTHDISKEEAFDAVRHIDAAVSRAPQQGVNTDMTVFRGVGSIKSVLADKRVGDVFEDKGYVSTTTEIEAAEDYSTGSVFSIHVPEGARGAWMRANDQLEGDDLENFEFVLPRGSQFEITKIDWKAKRVEMRLLVEPDSPADRIVSGPESLSKPPTVAEAWNDQATALNARLRAGEAADETGALDLLDSAVTEAAAESYGWTGMSVEDARAFLTLEPGEGVALAMGRVVTDRGFVAVKPLRTEATGDVMVKVLMPKGTHGIDLRGEGGDMILARGTDYRVITHGTAPGGGPFVVVEARTSSALTKLTDEAGGTTPKTVTPKRYSDDEYIAGLQRERYTITNQINGLLAKEKRGTTTDADRGRLEALRKRMADVRALIKTPDAAAERARVQNQINYMRRLVKAGTASPETVARLKLLEERRDELSALARSKTSQKVKREVDDLAEEESSAARLAKEKAMAQRIEEDRLERKIEADLAGELPSGELRPNSPYSIGRHLEGKSDDEWIQLPEHTSFAGGDEAGYLLKRSVAMRHNNVIVKLEVSPSDEIEKIVATRAPRMFKMIDDLEPTMRAKLDMVQSFDGYSPSDAHWRELIPGFDHAGAQGGRGEIVFWAGERQIRQPTFDHEMGHIVGYKGGPHIEQEWRSAMARDEKRGANTFGRDVAGTGDGETFKLGAPSVSDYGSSNLHEDWAESIKLYLSARRKEASIGRRGIGTYRREDGLVDIVSFEEAFPARAKLIEKWLNIKPVEKAATKAAVKATESEALLERYKSVVSRERMGVESMNYNVEVVSFKDGGDAVYKSVIGKAEADAEELAVLVARAVNARVPTVARISDEELLFEKVEGHTAVDLGVDLYERAVASDEGHKLGILDLLIANRDRHRANWMVGKDGEPIGIDHGLTFVYTKFDSKLGEIDVEPASSFSESLVRTEAGSGYLRDHAIVGYKANRLTKQDAEVMLRNLTALRNDFVRLGHEDWYEQMLVRANKVAQMATGKVNLISGA